MKFVPASESEFVPASHEDPKTPGVLKRVIAMRDEFQIGRVQMLNWARLPSRSSFRLHYHEDMQEVFVLLTGKVRMDVDGHTFVMRPGDTVIVAPREMHQMSNETDQDAQYIVFGIASGENGRTIVMEEPDMQNHMRPPG